MTNIATYSVGLGAHTDGAVFDKLDSVLIHAKCLSDMGRNPRYIIEYHGAEPPRIILEGEQLKEAIQDL